jgi:hypothetical protein
VAVAAVALAQPPGAVARAVAVRGAVFACHTL